MKLLIAVLSICLLLCAGMLLGISFWELGILGSDKYTDGYWKKNIIQGAVFVGLSVYSIVGLMSFKKNS